MKLGQKIIQILMQKSALYFNEIENVFLCYLQNYDNNLSIF